MIDGPAQPADSESIGDDAALHGDQYTIPLLDDVLVPGIEVLEDVEEPLPPARPPLESVEDDESQAVIRRLTNEIEVIVQTGVETAVNDAVQEITEQVKKHVAIMLPEILDEISDIKTRKNRI